MSQQARDRIEMFYKSVIVLLMSVCGYFLIKIDQKVDRTEERTIRLEEKLSALQERINLQAIR